MVNWLAKALSIAKRPDINKRVIIFLVILFTSFCVKEAICVTWWSENYKYRKQITITAGSVNLSTGTTVKITLDTSALETAGQLRSDRKDLRIVYWNGSSNVEVDRLISSNDIYIKLQAEVGANTTNSNYYVYYGNIH